MKKLSDLINLKSQMTFISDQISRLRRSVATLSSTLFKGLGQDQIHGITYIVLVYM